MNKVLCVSIMAIISLMSQPGFGDNGSNKGKRGIYYCTKDLHALKSISNPSDKSIKGFGENYIEIREGDDPEHTIGRHCFILSAEKMITSPYVYYPLIGERKTIFRIIDSLGYGVDRDDDKYGIVGSEKWLMIPEERNKFSVSCIKIMQEGDLKDDGSSVETVDLVSAFNKLSEDMRKDASSRPYSITPPKPHHCCAVAYDNVKKNHSFKKEGVSRINKRYYNIMGWGHKFEWTVEDAIACLLGGARAIEDGLMGLIKSISASSRPSSYLVANVFSSNQEESDDLGNEKNTKPDEL